MSDNQEDKIEVAIRRRIEELDAQLEIGSDMYEITEKLIKGTTGEPVNLDKERRETWGLKSPKTEEGNFTDISGLVLTAPNIMPDMRAVSPADKATADFLKYGLVMQVGIVVMILIGAFVVGPGPLFPVALLSLGFSMGFTAYAWFIRRK